VKGEGGKRRRQTREGRAEEEGVEVCLAFGAEVFAFQAVGEGQVPGAAV
jgi:hypothetical protein